MTALGYALGLAAVIAVCWFLGLLEERRQRWVVSPHSYSCHDCRTGFSDARTLVWHRQAVHVDTYDFGRAPHVVHRRIDAGRNSAGEILDRVKPGGREAPGDRPHETKARGPLSSTEEQC